MMKTWCVGILAYALTTQVAMAERLDAVAAVVNGQAVTCYEVQLAEDALRKQLAQQGSAASPDEALLFSRALDGRIMRALQHQEATTLGLKIASAEVDAAVADVEQRNKLQAGQLAAVLKAQGVDMAEYRENLKDRLMNTRLMSMAVRSKLNVSEEAMREYYRKHLQHPKPMREVRIAQMFIALPAEADAHAVKKTRTKADADYHKLMQGASFERMVSLQSDAPNAAEGGDMGWLAHGAVAGAFAQVFELEIGEMTKPIRSPAGFHILKVTDARMRKPENTEPYNEVHARHILIQIPDSAGIATQAKIHERVQRIAQEMQDTSDEAFAVRAKELSQGPSSSRGGDLGWFKRGQMVKAFDDAVFTLQAGETSGVVSTQFGLHVIRLVEKRRVNPNAFEAHKAKIEQLLMDTEMQQQVPRWLRSIKSKAKISYRTCKVS